jgi:hypothetical protein
MKHFPRFPKESFDKSRKAHGRLVPTPDFLKEESKAAMDKKESVPTLRDIRNAGVTLTEKLIPGRIIKTNRVSFAVSRWRMQQSQRRRNEKANTMVTLLGPISCVGLRSSPFEATVARSPI